MSFEKKNRSKLVSIRLTPETYSYFLQRNLNISAIARNALERFARENKNLPPVTVTGSPKLRRTRK